MENILFKVLSFILLVALLFIAPLYNMMLRQDIIIQQMVHYSVEKLADSVRECGYLTKNMYDEFNSEILSTGTDYIVNLKHYSKEYFESDDEYQADYSLNLEEDIIEALNKDHIYYLRKGDLFAVEVISQYGTLGMNMSRMMTGEEGSPIYARAGGMVMNENH